MAMPPVCGLGARELQALAAEYLLGFPCKFYSPLKISFVCFFLLKKNRNKRGYVISEPVSDISL